MQSATKYIYTERKNNVYQASDVIEWNISPVDPIINTKDLYIAMEVTLQSSQYKVCPSFRSGLSGLIRVLTVSAGTGTVLESISNYGLIYGTRNYYENTDSLFFRKTMHEGQPLKTVLDDSSCNQYFDATASTDVYKKVEVILPLYLSGCLSPDRADPFINMATKGLNIKIDTETAISSLQIVQAPLYNVVNDIVVRTGTFGGYENDSGYCIYDVDSSNKYVILKNVNDPLPEDAYTDPDIKFVLSANVEKPAHLFLVGQKIMIGNVQYEVKKIEIYDDGEGQYRIKLTTERDLNGVSEDDVLFVDATVVDANYNLANVRMNVNTILPTENVVNEIANKINKSNYSFNIFSFTDYPVNISANSKNNSLKVVCNNTMATGIICLPQNSLSNSLFEDSMKLDKQTPYSYNFLLYNSIAVPSKLVDLRKFNNTNTYLYNAVALREMHKALTSCKWNVNNLLEPSNQFFVGRELAKRDYYYNCNNELTLNINYENIDNGVLMHCVICHERTIICTAGNVQVII
jgi:hypothetical protein